MADKEQKPKSLWDLKSLARRRAWDLAQKAYEKYVGQIERALSDGSLKPNNIDSWTPRGE